MRWRIPVSPMIGEHASSSIPGSQASGDLSSRVLDSLNAAVAVIDHNGTIRAINDAWRKFAVDNGGTKEATGIGVNYLDVCQSAEGDDWYLAQQAYRGIKQVLDGTRDVFSVEYPCHSPTEKRWFLLTVSRLKGDPAHAVATHVSITERKRVELQLIESERLAAVGQAMRGLSHEGRNSLQRAQGCIDLLRCQIEQDSEATELVAKIESAQHQLISLFEEVRRYAAPITLQRTPYRLNQLVQEVWKSFEAYHDRYRFSHLPTSLNLVGEMDVKGIGQVLRSLFDNAISTDANSSMIEVCYAAEELDGASAVTAIVSDNGSGIPVTDREHVFEPFFTTKIRGTGLGLSISKRIVEAHGGCISLGDSHLGGTSVFLTLPICAPNR